MNSMRGVEGISATQVSTAGRNLERLLGQECPLTSFYIVAGFLHHIATITVVPLPKII